MKTLLIYPPSESVYGLPRYPTLGITYLATVLARKGLSVDVLDMRLPKNDFELLRKKLKVFSPDLVGVGSTSFDFPGAQKVFRVVKRFSPKIITILGGPHASVCSQEAMVEKAIDYLLIGEGEIELPRLIKALKGKKDLTKIKGLFYRKSPKRIVMTNPPELIKNLNNLPFPQWDLHSLDNYRVRGDLRLPLMTSRGCPYSCVYCVSYKTHGKMFRFRSPKNVVDEIENNIKKYGAKKFSILDDNFTLNPERALKICQEITKRKLSISWTCDQGIRADMVNKKLFKAMKTSGCQLVALGVESANQVVLDKMKKGETIDRIRQAILDAKSVGLIVKAFFIVGGPGDNLTTTQESIRFFKESDVDIPRFGMMTAYPGSELWDWVKKNGRFIGDPYRHILQTPTTFKGVQFDTKDFSKKERLLAFEMAEKEAEIWSIRQTLIRKLGSFLGRIFFWPFYLGFLRKLVKRIYRLRIFSATD